MSEANSKARKKYWGSMSSEERSRRMSSIAKIKQSKMSVEEKRLHAMKMVKGRKV